MSGRAEAPGGFREEAVAWESQPENVGKKRKYDYERGKEALDKGLKERKDSGTVLEYVVRKRLR